MADSAIYTVVDRNGNEHTFDEEAEDCSYWFNYEHDMLVVTKSGPPLTEVARFYMPVKLTTIWE